MRNAIININSPDLKTADLYPQPAGTFFTINETWAANTVYMKVDSTHHKGRTGLVRCVAFRSDNPGVGRGHTIERCYVNAHADITIFDDRISVTFGDEEEE